MLFLPQRSYLPIGSLRGAVSYPLAQDTYADDEIVRYSTCAGLTTSPPAWTMPTTGASGFRPANSSGWLSCGCC